jgi:hypothetical protein
MSSRDWKHASVWAFEVTGDVISAGEPGGHLSVRKLLTELNSKFTEYGLWSFLVDRGHQGAR